MMKLAIVNNTKPFLRGGAEILADSLTTRLSEAGHVVELVRLPFSWDPPEHIADAMLAAQLTNIAGVDRVIALKFPAYLVPHHEKIVWLLHQFRQFYEVWDDDAPHDPGAEAVRQLVIRADDRHLVEARCLFANSDVTAARLRRFNGLDAEVLYPPLANPDTFQPLVVGDYIFAGGRINAFKRQLLAVEAMAHTTSGVRLIVAGSPEASGDLEALHVARDASGCRDRITIIPRYIDETDKVDLVNRSLACVYSPIDEDSYGYVTLEGAQASKALITTSDAGGILQLVVDGRTGIVCQPDPRELGRAFDTLFRFPNIATELGRAAHERMLELGISWDHVIQRLLA
jgi:glycosyltransferase involved in cell wall biosynthesis